MVLSFVLSAHAAEPAAVAKPDPVAAKAARGFARRVAAHPEELVPKLVERLVRDTDDPALRARRIHDWVALTVSYDAEGYRTHHPPPSDWMSTLQSRSAVCAGYANLFQHLASLAGLDTKVVEGYSRGYDYDPLD